MFSACILAKNSEATLPSTLASLCDCSEVLLVDTGSRDRTLEIARSFPNVSIRETPFTGFGELRNLAAEWAKYDWILAIDTDEVLSKELREELFNLSLDPNCVYAINRHNYYNKKKILGCGWHPERCVRLYHRDKTAFSNRAVHEKIIPGDLKIIELKSPIYHTPYRSTSDFLAKMQHYSDLFAKEFRGKKRATFATALGHGIWAFLKSYLLKRGIFCGKEGFLISLYNANTAFYKYLKLAEANQTLSR